ncbi:hypothetical protein HAX54_046468, partial [Datura stramonium]|nr:hypothetical protein [Datura stramonium]
RPHLNTSSPIHLSLSLSPGRLRPPHDVPTVHSRPPVFSSGHRLSSASIVATRHSPVAATPVTPPSASSNPPCSLASRLSDLASQSSAANLISDLHEWCNDCPAVSDMDPVKLNSP